MDWFSVESSRGRRVGVAQNLAPVLTPYAYAATGAGLSGREESVCELPD
jgi:hypothetical protein